jgi:sulfatase modifying factor 1
MLKPSTFLPRMLWMGLVCLSGCGDGSAATPAADPAVDAGVPSDTTDVAIVQPSSPLGALCGTDDDCETGAWCSRVRDFRRCSPSVFSGESHQMDFVYVPAGTFQQGTPGARNQYRPFAATLTRNYFVSRTEVTQGQWKAATGRTNPSCFQNTSDTSCTTTNAFDAGPVETVDWYSAVAYANWLSSRNDLQQCYTLSGCSNESTGWHDGQHDGCTGAMFTGLDCAGYRLLTESEWERAARGGRSSTYYWGEATDATTVGRHAWLTSNSGGRTQAVGQKVMNAYGLYDMSGNVQEWVWDWMWEPFRWIYYPRGSATDYLGGSSGSSRGFRGGHWNGGSARLGSAYRNGTDPYDRHMTIGFRLARTVP